MYTLAMKIGIYNLAASAVCPDYSKAVLNNKSPAKKEKNIGKTFFIGAAFKEGSAMASLTENDAVQWKIGQGFLAKYTKLNAKSESELIIKIKSIYIIQGRRIKRYG